MERDQRIYDYYSKMSVATSVDATRSHDSGNSQAQGGPIGLLRNHEIWKDSEVDRVVRESKRRETERILKEFETKRQK